MNKKIWEYFIEHYNNVLSPNKLSQLPLTEILEMFWFFAHNPVNEDAIEAILNKYSIPLPKRLGED